MLASFQPTRISTDKGVFHLRLIEQADNAAVADIIRTVMTEFSCVGQGYSIEDPELNDMYSAYNEPRSAFFVLEHEGKIFGTGGVGPLVGARAGVCELRKMYFRPQIRGLGLGKRMLQCCLTAARTLQFDYCYLETVARMKAAARLYKTAGFVTLNGPMGHTGHSGCDHFYGLVL